MAGEVRHPIDIASLEAYIQKSVPEITAPVEVKQFGFGQSNPTYQLTDAVGSKFVLRKKPPGELLSKSAHKVEREYRVIHALRDTDVPVPKAFTLCENVSIIGTPFYIMSFIPGRIIEDPSLPGLSPFERLETWRSAIRTLAALHSVSPSGISLSSYGKSHSFYARQISTIHAISTSQSNTVSVSTGLPVGPIPHITDLLSFFSTSRPSTPKDRAVLVHGDFKIDNLVFHPSLPQVVGILDWEMSTIGHPLADLSNLLQPFMLASAPELRTVRPHAASFNSVVVPGLPTREQCIAWYAAEAGWVPAPNEVRWAAAFDVLRAAMIVQGIKARVAKGQASSAKAEEYARQVEPLGEVVWRMIGELKRQEWARL
ncbi:MAG: hypothetical protein M1814_000268 [Vezdaea aestivalis]|nr:MAG: hypothetical protein M1814_000268 [Vezdaea aestivalis]